jgi:hypothetical protein
VEPGSGDPDHPDHEMQQRADHGADRRPEDPEAVAQRERAHDKAHVVEQRREAIEEEPALCDQDLAERDRGRKDDRRDEHDPEQVGVEVPLVRPEAGRDDRCRLAGKDEEDRRRDAHDEHGQRQDRLAERLGGARGLVLEAQVDRHERRREPASDQHVERELRQDEGRVVRVELSRQSERPREQPISEQADAIGRERERGEQQRPARQVAVDQAPDDQAGGLGPKIARPTRTIVAPSSTATG